MKITTNHHEYRFKPVGNTIRNVVEMMEKLDCNILYNSKTGKTIFIKDLYKTLDILSEFCHVDTMN